MRVLAGACICLACAGSIQSDQITHDSQTLLHPVRDARLSNPLQAFAALILATNPAAELSGLMSKFGAVSGSVNDAYGKGTQILLRDARGNKDKMLSAYRTLKNKLDADPENTSLKLACAEALVSVMRIAGHANSLTCHLKKSRRGVSPEIRTSDTPEVRALWAEFAPTAQSLLSDVERSVGKDAFSKKSSMYSLSVEAVMYATASKGIISSILSGKAPAFLRRVGKLEKMHKDWDSAQYCTYRGAYYLAAPKPVNDAKKAHTYFEHAAKTNPSSRRNQYFAGVGRFGIGDYTGAREAMERALKSPCLSESEKDIGDFLRAESARTVQMLKDNGY